MVPQPRATEPGSAGPRAQPNVTFALLVGLSAGVLGGLAWSTHHLLVAGAPGYAPGDAWPGAACLLLPLADDLAPHLASYLFLASLAAGVLAALRTLLRQDRQTRALLRLCLARRLSPGVGHTHLEQVARHIGLAGRLDVAQVAEPVAFCYGFLRPRIVVSWGLAETLPRRQLVALLLHEREHLRQRDPLKVALGRLCTSAAFFVPAAETLYRRFLVEKELAADRAAMAELGGPRELARALTSLLERSSILAPPTGLDGAIVARGDEALEARIDALLGDPVPLGPRLGYQSLLSSASVLVVASLPLLLAPLPGAERLADAGLFAGCHLPDEPLPSPS